MVLVCTDLFNIVSRSATGCDRSTGADFHRIPSGGITTFGPLIIQAFGYDSFTTILLNIPFGAVQIVATIGGAYLATYLKKKGPVLALLCFPPIVGCAMLLAISHTPANRGALLAGYYLVSSKFTHPGK